MMDYMKESERISNIIENMEMKKFEEMLYNCGIESIQSSIESDYIRCLDNDIQSKTMNYKYKNSSFNADSYEEYTDFSFTGQGVA